MTFAGSRAGRRLMPAFSAIMLIALGTSLSGAARTLTEKKKTPLDPEVEKALAAFAEKSAPVTAEQFKKHMDGVIQAIGKAASLTPEDTEKLNQASAKAVEEAVKIWKPLFPAELRVDISTLTPSLALSRVQTWKAAFSATQRFVEN